MLVVSSCTHMQAFKYGIVAILVKSTGSPPGGKHKSTSFLRRSNFAGCCRRKYQSAVSVVAVVSDPATTARKPSERMTSIDGFTSSNPSSSVYIFRESENSLFNDNEHSKSLSLTR